MSMTLEATQMLICWQVFSNLTGDGSANSHSKVYIENFLKLISPWTKWPPFRRFLDAFLWMKSVVFD